MSFIGAVILKYIKKNIIPITLFLKKKLLTCNRFCRVAAKSSIKYYLVCTNYYCNCQMKQKSVVNVIWYMLM